MLDATLLLKEAEELFDKSARLKTEAHKKAWRNGFTSGAAWMRAAMEELRSEALPANSVNFAWLGFAKYLLACSAALIAMTLACFLSPWFSIIILPAFYIAEVQWVFLFPVALDGSFNPWHESRELMKRHAGTFSAMCFVLPFACRMLTGGFCGHGFVRSWCLGCLAVTLWYERCVKATASSNSLQNIPKLDLFQRAPLYLRNEIISFTINCKVRLLLVTDLHLRSSTAKKLLTGIDEAISLSNPDLIVLGGDLADSAPGLDLLTHSLSVWAKNRPVLAVPGNHDRWLSEELVREQMLLAGVQWLPDADYVFVKNTKETILFTGSQNASLAGVCLPIISVLHDPNNFLEEVSQGAELVLAGHLHGCQFVWSEIADRLIPGAWFYRWNVLRAEHGIASMIVSRGCADTLPMRWNCPREVVICDLIPKA